MDVSMGFEAVFGCFRCLIHRLWELRIAGGGELTPGALLCDLLSADEPQHS